MTDDQVEKIKNLFADRYQNKLGIGYQAWLENGPQTEEEAFARLQEIDDELKGNYEEWQTLPAGQDKDELETYRDKLKAEYDLIEEAFGLELHDQ